MHMQELVNLMVGDSEHIFILEEEINTAICGQHQSVFHKNDSWLYSIQLCNLASARITSSRPLGVDNEGRQDGTLS